MQAKVLRTFSYKKQLYLADQIMEISEEEGEYLNSSKSGLLVEPMEVLRKIDWSIMTKKELIEYAQNNQVEINPKATKDMILKEMMLWIEHRS